MLILLTFIIELILSAAIALWLVATLGFADEANRSRKATPTGRVIAILCVFFALASPAVALGIIVRYYFFTPLFQNLHPLLPGIIVMAVSFCLCRILIYLYNRSYKQ